MIQDQNLCQIHSGEQLVGCCQNRDCKVQLRAYCKLCEDKHQNNQQYKRTIVEISKLITEFKSFGQERLEDTKMRCQIQTFFLHLELIEFTKQWKEKFYQIIYQIMSYICNLENEFKEINHSNYSTKNEILQGYFNNYQLKLIRIDKQLDNYHNYRQVDLPKSETTQQQFVQAFMEQQEKFQLEIIKDQQNNFVFKKNIDKIENPMFIISEISVKESNQYLQLGYEKNIKFLSDQVLKFQNILLKNNLEDEMKSYIISYAYLALGNPEQSLEIINQELLNKQNYQSLYVKGLCRYNDSLQIYEKGMELNDKYMLNYLGKAKILQITKRHDDCLNEYYKQIEKNPITIYTIKKVFIIDFCRAIIQKNLDKFQESLQSINKAIELNPTQVELFQFKATILKKLKRNYDFLDCIDQIIIFNPIFDNYQEKVEFLKLTQQYEILKIYPNNYEITVQKGLAYSYLRNYEQAIKTFDQIINQKVKFFEAYYQKVQLMIQKKKNQPDVLEIYNQYINLDPQNFDGYHEKLMFQRNLNINLKISQKFTNIIIYEFSLLNKIQYMKFICSILILWSSLRGLEDLKQSKKISQQSFRLVQTQNQYNLKFFF
ncbi:tetratricopeptide repeat [Paramecium bursaria]